MRLLVYSILNKPTESPYRRYEPISFPTSEPQN
jgi:hypothetical protein